MTVTCGDDGVWQLQYKIFRLLMYVHGSCKLAAYQEMYSRHCENPQRVTKFSSCILHLHVRHI